MICSDIWQINTMSDISKLLYVILRQFWNITSGIYAKYQVQIMLLFVYTTTRKRFVIFTCRYFKLRWNTTALSRSNCRNSSCSSINSNICTPRKMYQFCDRIMYFLCVPLGSSMPVCCPYLQVHSSEHWW